jgi:hypothetical protein
MAFFDHGSGRIAKGQIKLAALVEPLKLLLTIVGLKKLLQLSLLAARGDQRVSGQHRRAGKGNRRAAADQTIRYQSIRLASYGAAQAVWV